MYSDPQNPIGFHELIGELSILSFLADRVVQPAVDRLSAVTATAGVIPQIIPSMINISRVAMEHVVEHH